MVHLAVAKYGKAAVRVSRIVRHPDGKHDFVEYIVRCLVEGDVARAWTHSDNAPIVATDSIKNTVNIFAKTSPHVLQPESFALHLGLHFVTKYAHLSRCSVDIVQLKWSRIQVNGQPHKHSFVRDGDEKRTVSVVIDATKGKNALTATCQGGITGLLCLKTTESAFEGYVFDEYTTLKPVDDRIFSTAVDCTYTIPISPSALSISALPKLGIDFDKIYKSVVDTTLEIFATHNSASVQATLYNMCEKVLNDNKEVSDIKYELPNKHYIAPDLSFFKLKNTDPKDAEVFTPVDAPSGHIIGLVTREPKAKL
ncbi:Uricase [Rhodotorula toruloides]|uniref:Uricase n=1 Tax=Rhodotorula toruloides TaxID=5286 RepID=A0A0K3CP09_RHOTO|nr:Uricase [Rhodotorula toruloides]PRQ71030.1 hypothetical protein AAT19DRAFT_10570 [Rhodotorula toruloides]